MRRHEFVNTRSRRRHPRRALIALTTLALISCASAPRAAPGDGTGAVGDAATSASAQPAIVRGIDHFFATSANPEPLYHLFRDTLGLPEVYPFRNYGDFASGVVSVGNVLFEVVTWSVPAGERLPTELKGIAFEPNGTVEESLSRLSKYGFAPQKPDSVKFPDQNGTPALAYVNIPLDGPAGLPPTSASIFINDNLGSPRAVARRKTGAEELGRRQGGVLGAVAVDELVIGVEDPQATVAKWRRLLGSPVGQTGDVITWPIGPATRFARAPRGAILEMVVRVRSLANARQVLEAKGMVLHEGGRLFIDPSRVEGLKARLVE